MKSNQLTYLLLLTILFVSCSTSKNIIINENEVSQKVLKKDFTITVNYALPNRGGQIYLSSDYDLRIKNDSSFAYLPYYGVAYVAPFNSSGGGIRFSEPMYDYVQTDNKKNDGWKISFKVKSKTSEIYVYLDIYKNGSSSITINSYERDAIRFSGEIKMN